METILRFLATMIQVVLPVYATVGVGFWAEKRFRLQAQTLAQLAYNILVPAFVFEHLHDLKVPLSQTGPALGMILSVHALVGLAALGVGKLLKLSRAGQAALVMVAVYGNIANLGLPMIRFQYGEPGLPGALIHMLAISTLGIMACVLAAEWASSGNLAQAIPRSILTPPVAAIAPSLLVNYYNIEIPLFLARTIGLLAGAAIPVMLLAMGVQLAGVSKFRWDARIGWAAALKLVLAPALVWITADWWGVEGLMRSTGILQAATPSAVTTAIVAIKYQTEPDLVTTTVLATTLLGLLTLSGLLTVV